MELLRNNYSVIAQECLARYKCILISKHLFHYRLSFSDDFQIRHIELDTSHITLQAGFVIFGS